MSPVQTFPPLFEAAMLYVAVVASRFEAETLRIRPSLRFFTVGADPHQLFRQAVIFALAPLHAFILIPLIDALQGRHKSQPRGQSLFRYGRWYLQFLVPSWVAILISRNIL
ncbi:hypothetical protein BKA66DRAFT_262613 [Pyrenochaeta sp. MPI-SDFR-AT-0127]|nr:hypothetical protein BKA66DRAFT_262613 [Pyrenochaeta sp. MPI-SDFR-AT-0127]